jgi:AraC family transcriptional regulator, ethanolamine operon transcriptional activator
MSEEDHFKIINHRFYGTEALEATVSDRSEFHVRQVKAEKMCIDVWRLSLKEAFFEFRTLNIPLRIWGDKNSQHLVFEFILSPILGQYLSHGFEMTTDTLYGFDNSRGIDLVLPAGLLMGTLLIKKEVFQEYSRLMEREDLNDRFFAKNYIQSPTAFSPVQDYLRELYTVVRRQSSFLKESQIHQLIIEDYVPLLIDAIPSTLDRTQKPRQFFRRSRVVRQAEEYMLAHLEKPITLKDLCQVINTSKSPLNRGFQEIFGLSPLNYLKILRLQAARQRLKTSSPETTTVTQIAHRFGFWHLGRFSRYYQEMFGELPSETLGR